MKYRDHPNMKLVWYEDLNTCFEDQVNDLSNFLGYTMTDENMKVRQQLAEASHHFYCNMIRPKINLCK